MKVNEIFYSLQGEGARTGIPSIFIRLSGCQAQYACQAKGIICDTNFVDFEEMNDQNIFEQISLFPCKNIIWTGGEPLQQLTQQTIDFFKEKNYFQSIETSGLFPCPKGIDYIVISPKINEELLQKNFTHVQELRYLIKKGDPYPTPTITADFYMLSPHSFTNNIDTETVEYVIDLCKNNPFWRLSLQTHKLIHIL